MAERTPLVRVSGYLRDLPAGDTVAGAGGGSYLAASGMTFVGSLSGSGSPTSAEFPSGSFGFWFDTGGFTYHLVSNATGDIKQTALMDF